MFFPVIVCLLAVFLIGCFRADKSEQRETVIVFKHGKMAGDPSVFAKLLNKFEAEHPGVVIRDMTLPASTDEQHQYYVINLEGRSADIDVLSMDVIWVPEFARAGWLRDLTHLITEEDKRDIFPGPMSAVTYNGRIYAVPWYIDAGVLYYRKDLLRKHGFPPPRTWHELVGTARHIMDREEGLYGFIWQGKQYEGLVCNVLEYFWGNGGDVLEDGDVVIDSRENIYALQFMRDLITVHGVTPPLVTTSIEEPTRHLFGNGKAIFMRNWPYAWNLFEQESSPVKGKVGVALLPSFRDGHSVSVLGGWQLGVNRYSRHPEEAEKLIRFLLRPENLKELALAVGYKPARRSLYHDDELRTAQPFVSSLYEVFMHARPRPVTPYYMMITQVLQPEFSAAVAGIKTPDKALQSARKQIEYILKVEE